MTDKPSAPTDKEADARFNETLKRLANTPHKPHKPAEQPKKHSPKTTRKP